MEIGSLRLKSRSRRWWGRGEAGGYLQPPVCKETDLPVTEVNQVSYSC